jgi:hypothetical protein
VPPSRPRVKRKLQGSVRAAPLLHRLNVSAFELALRVLITVGHPGGSANAAEPQHTMAPHRFWQSAVYTEAADAAEPATAEGSAASQRRSSRSKQVFDFDKAMWNSSSLNANDEDVDMVLDEVPRRGPG